MSIAENERVKVARRRDVEVLRRDPRGATSSLRWVTPDRAQPPDWNAHQAYDLAYYMDPITYACVRAIAETISALPFRAGPDLKNRENHNPNSPLARMLGAEPPDGPCPGLGASELWYAAVRDYLVAGRFGWEIELAGDKIAALWPLTAAALNPVPTKSGTSWFSGFEYGRSGEEVNLPTDRVFYVWHPSGNDYRQPESALRAASLPVSVSIMQARYDYSFLKNDARPATIIVTEEFEDEDSYRAFQAQWNSEYAGVDNAGKSAFLEAKGSGDQGVKGAVDVHVVGITPRDMQARERASARQKEIAIALGVPWSRLDASGRTFDNASQEDEIFWRQTLLPLITRLQNAVNVQLAPRLGTDFGWFDLSEVPVLQKKSVDPTTAAVGAPSMVQGQLMTINEARADYGLEPIPGGDRLMTAEEVQALHQSAPPTQMGGPEGETREPAVEPPPAAKAPASSITRTEPVVPEGDHADRRARIWRVTDGKMKALERQWNRSMTKLFLRQQRSVLARLDAKRGRTLVRTGDVRASTGEVFDPQHWLNETLDDVAALYEAVTAAGGTRVSDLFGLAFDIEAPWAQDFIQARANQLAGQVTDTTYRAIQDALAAGIGEGESIPELSARIKAVFDVATSSRATTIARTEVVSAFNGSAMLTASSYGADVVAGQEWIATNDARTRDEHAQRDGEIVGIGEMFSGGLAYPGDPSGDPADTVNCRCTVAFLTPDEMDNRAGGRARLAEMRTALAVLRMVAPGAENVEQGIRAALRAA